MAIVAAGVMHAFHRIMGQIEEQVNIGFTSGQLCRKCIFIGIGSFPKLSSQFVASHVGIIFQYSK